MKNEGGEKEMPSRSNYVCVPCKKEMERLRSGVIVEEHRENGEPYKIWSADLWTCPKCHHQCILGFGDRPVAQYFDSHYLDVQKDVEFHIN